MKGGHAHDALMLRGYCPAKLLEEVPAIDEVLNEFDGLGMGRTTGTVAAHVLARSNAQRNCNSFLASADIILLAAKPHIREGSRGWQKVDPDLCSQQSSICGCRCHLIRPQMSCVSEQSTHQQQWKALTASTKFRFCNSFQPSY